jgi:hypothetical protein
MIKKADIQLKLPCSTLKKGVAMKKMLAAFLFVVWSFSPAFAKEAYHIEV